MATKEGRSTTGVRSDIPIHIRHVRRWMGVIRADSLIGDDDVDTPLGAWVLAVDEHRHPRDFVLNHADFHQSACEVGQIGPARENIHVFRRPHGIPVNGGDPG